jgi:acyl-CoA synthetase (AMP-forming)/AMP-acid ligase II
MVANVTSPQGVNRISAISWIECIQDRVKDPSDFVKINFHGELTGSVHSLTLSELNHRATAVAAVLQQRKLTGERAILLYHPGIEYLIALVACFYSGVVAVPVFPPKVKHGMERIAAIMDNAGSVFLMTSSEVKKSLASEILDMPRFSAAQWLTTDTVDPQCAAGWVMNIPHNDALALLQYTSGSTGSPKGVMLTHGHLFSNSQTIKESMGLDKDSVGVIWLPPFHDMGLIGGLLQPLYSGFPVHLMSPASFLQRPMRWLELISRFKGTVSAAPNFAFDLCVRRAKPDHLAQLDLSSWRVAANGAEPIRADTLHRFAQTFAPCGFNARAFFPCYGMAETTLYVTGAGVGRGMRTATVSRSALSQRRWKLCAEGDDALTLVSSGFAPETTSLRIVDPDTCQILGADQVGEIWVRSDSVASGYWQQPALTHATFKARLVDAATTSPGELEPWLRTGDLGLLHEGELYVTGRIKDMLIMGGRNHYPQDLEATALAASADMGVHRVMAFGIEPETGTPIGAGERLVLLVELDRKRSGQPQEAVAAAIRQAISLQHQVQVSELHFVGRGSLPHTSSGKPQRYLARERLLAGTLLVLPDEVSVQPRQELAV